MDVQTKMFSFKLVIEKQYILHMLIIFNITFKTHTHTHTHISFPFEVVI
jgi:hypothetical protein